MNLLPAENNSVTGLAVRRNPAAERRRIRTFVGWGGMSFGTVAERFNCLFPRPGCWSPRLFGLVCCLVLLFASAFDTRAAQSSRDIYIFSEIGHQQSLSHSSVICIYKDRDELMWFGTYDGLNCFDGQGMEVYRSDFSKSQTLDNNVIFSIDRADGNNLWISTSNGVNLFSRDRRCVVASYAFPAEGNLRSNAKGNAWMVSPDSISYYNTRLNRFVRAEGVHIPVSDPGRQMFVCGTGELWLFPDAPGLGDMYRISVDSFDRESPVGGVIFSKTRFHHRAIEMLFCQDDKTFCFIDSNKDLYIYDALRQIKVYIRNVSPLLEKYGPIVGIVPFYDDLMIAFRTNGLVQLRATESYREEVIDRNLRIFCLYKDSEQGILWIGVDGKGAMMYMKRHSVATNLLLPRLSQNFTRQVRSILTDSHGALWFGTKGDGLVRIRDYADGMYAADRGEVFYPGKRQPVSTYTRDDVEFPVYSLRQSRYMDGFWVGSGPAGLFYYRHDGKGLQHLGLPSGVRLEEIHKVYEADDTTLYAATSNGFFRLRLDKSKGRISARSVHKFRFFYEQQELCTFYSMIDEGDSILWLGSRERGVVRFDMSTDEYLVYSLRELTGRPVDDVLCLYRTRSGDLLVGTSAGLVRMHFNGKRIETRYTGREQGLLNDMIHGMLEDADGFLWLSTNKGLIKYNPGDDSSHAYYYSGGVQIGEFSDDAYYECPYTGRLFFGGMNGLLYLERYSSNDSGYYPDILLRGLSFGVRPVSLADYYDRDAGLSFKQPESDFTLSFAVPDYISGPDIEYSWKLEGYDQEWSPFGVLNAATYTDVPVGNYLFRVRYRKDIFDSGSRTLEVPLHILPLWYQTNLARGLFAVLSLSGLFCFFYLLRGSIRHKRVIGTLLQMEKGPGAAAGALCGNRELVAGLTSIYQASVRMQELQGDDAPIGAADRIKETVLSLLFPAGLLDDSDLRNSPPLGIFAQTANACIKSLSDDAMRSAVLRNPELGNIEVDIPGSFVFPVYVNAVRIFFGYVYLFAAGQKRFVVTVSESDGMMIVSFRSSRTLLRELRDRLVGSESSSEPCGASAAFVMQLLHRLVRVMVGQLNPVIAYSEEESVLSCSFLPAAIDAGKAVPADQKSVLLLEDHDGMCGLAEAVLSEKYAVCRVRSIQQAVEFLQHARPVAFVIDMMVYSEDEAAFMEFLHRNESLLARTAIVLMLPWKGFSRTRRDLILHADAFVVLPYDVVYLGEIVHRAVFGRMGVKQLRVDGLAENVANMFSCTTGEQVEFIRRMVSIIEENIDRENLGSSFIADRLAMSSRQFYRKFKEVSDSSPAEFIKNYRLEKAAALLLGGMPIKEVIVEIGITSRSYFYREFTARYGMTPSDFRTLHHGSPDDRRAG